VPSALPKTLTEKQKESAYFQGKPRLMLVDVGEKRQSPRPMELIE
jgi:hypothetical protein